MNSDLACEALKSQRCLVLAYRGKNRVVEVHIVGHTQDGELLMRVWQVRGGSNGGQATGWKLLRIETVTAARLSDEQSQAPREGYNRFDPAITQPICQY
jgi:hypothetical protein